MCIMGHLHREVSNQDSSATPTETLTVRVAGHPAGGQLAGLLATCRCAALKLATSIMLTVAESILRKPYESLSPNTRLSLRFAVDGSFYDDETRAAILDWTVSCAADCQTAPWVCVARSFDAAESTGPIRPSDRP